MCNSQHTNLRCRTLLKLPLGLIGISDVGVVKRRFPYWIQKEFQRTEWLKKPLAKVVDFELLGALLGPGAPDPDLARLGFSRNSRNPYNYWLK